MKKTLVCLPFLLTLFVLGTALTVWAASPKVELYVTSWCPYCKIAERTLQMKGIPYTLYDVEHDSEGIKRYQQFGANGVPIIKIGDRVIHGFNLEAITALLGTDASPKDKTL